MASLKEFLDVWKSDCPTIEAHTSGSTGTPKIIHLSKNDMRESARATNTFFGINSESVLASPLSVDYIAGKMMVVRSEEARCRLIELPVSNEITIPKNEKRIDLLPIVPSQIESLLNQPHLASVVRNLLIGGAAPTTEDCHKLTLAGYRSFISYGMTETCSHVALAHGEDSRRVFHAMPGISFETDDEGKLIINASAFTFKRIVTNDLATLLSGRAMIWRGRADGVINSGGIKLIPEELESMYREFLPSYNYFVKGVKDSRWGESIALVVEADENKSDLIMQVLRKSIQDHRRLPKTIITVPALARTSNGKVKRN